MITSGVSQSVSPTTRCILEARQSPSTRWRDTSLASHLVAKRQRRRGGPVVGALAAGGRRSKRIACQSFKTFSRHTLLPVSLWKTRVPWYYFEFPFVSPIFSNLPRFLESRGRRRSSSFHSIEDARVSPAVPSFLALPCIWTSSIIKQWRDFEGRFVVFSIRRRDVVGMEIEGDHSGGAFPSKPPSENS